MHGKRLGKTIRMFLMDGVPNGRMACELSNWTGKAYKIPRSLVKTCADRPELRSTGVYLLFGKSEETTGGMVYVGEAEDVFRRLTQHLQQKDFWHEAVVFISKDDNLNKAHIKYLENGMYALAQAASRFVILNSTKPTQSAISEADMAEMAEFLEKTKMLVSILGYRVFEPLREVTPAQNGEEVAFSLTGPRGANATGQPTSDGFVVLQGSSVAVSVTKSCAPGFTKLRETLTGKEILVEREGSMVFASDYLFTSPSTAAAVVLGRNANGLTEWQTKTGKTLKDVEGGNQNQQPSSLDDASETSLS